MSITMSDVEMSLPNGFHDARLRGLTIDYVTRTATIDLEPDMSDDTSTSIIYRRARLHLSDLGFFAIEPPDPRYPYHGSILGRVDLDEVPPDAPVPAARPGRFCSRLFVESWNAFIYFEAKGARLEWLA